MPRFFRRKKPMADNQPEQPEIKEEVKAEEPKVEAVEEIKEEVKSSVCQDCNGRGLLNSDTECGNCKGSGRI